MESNKRQLRLIIHGLVQGVGFRYEARRQAKTLGLRGWVRNAPSGTVEAMLEGAPDQVEAFRRWAEHGPGEARVDRVDVEAAVSQETFDDFEIR